MKKRILIAALFTVMLITALSVSASAKWWDENPFKDVKSDAWYYDAVRICNENELFNGTSDTTFTPSMKMSRAMLAQVLANADGYDKTEYTGSSFKDVKPTAWYASAVEWANQKGITTGVGGGKFAPDTLISREQLATMLRRYAEYKGMDITVENASFEGFADADKVSEWAKQGVEWAVEKGVIKGADVKGTLYLNPQNNAARSECAQMLSNFLYIEPRYEINGNDISLYTIVYPAGCLDHVKAAAEDLSKYIEYSIGIKLPVTIDETELSDYEILVGETNREEKGIVIVDRASFKDDQQFICNVQGDHLVITGIDDSTDFNNAEDRSHHNIMGTYNGVYYFLEKAFGLEFYFSTDGIIAEPDPVISLEDGYLYTDHIAFETMGMYIHSIGEEGYLGTDYYESWGCGLPHQIGNLMTGRWKDGNVDNTWSNPCYSDPKNVEALIANIRELLASEPELNLIGLIQNDSDTICTNDCESCSALISKYGTRGAPLFCLVNTVAETFAEEEPDVRFATWAYTWSEIPPKSDFKFHDNVILYYNTIKLCPCHEYTDTTCSKNKNSSEYIKKWDSITNKLYLWEHTGSFGDAMAPMFDLDSINKNQRYFYENGVRGAFLNGRCDRPSNLMEVRAYLFNRLWRDPMMTDEEYNYRLNGFLEAYYGDAYKHVRNYIDTINEIGNVGCTDTHSKINNMYDFDLVYENGAKINALWDKAEAEADNAEYLERIKVHRLSWTYLWQCARYEKDYTNGNTQSKNSYKEVSRVLYEEILLYDVKWGYGFSDEPSGNLELPPNRW